MYNYIYSFYVNAMISLISHRYTLYIVLHWIILYTLYNRHGQILNSKKSYPKFMVAQNCTKKGSRNILFTSESYHNFKVNSTRKFTSKSR